MDEKLAGSYQTGPNRTRWLIDLIRLEIALWERLDGRLKKEHNLSLAYFETLYFIMQQSEKSLRVGDLAKMLRVTVGGTSKLVDRVEADGLIRREADPTNRRASLIFPTVAGEDTFTAARATFEAEMSQIFEGVLGEGEQQQMYDFIGRLLKSNLTVRLEAGS
jgi:DNA-binding MarR family transcriptional regulator